MPALAEPFHSIANWHYRIIIGTDCTKAALEEKSLDMLSPEELKAQQERLIKLLDSIENDVMIAQLKLAELKAVIYKKINPESQL